MDLNPKILRYCLWLLSRRDYSVFEVKKKLTEKKYTVEEIDTVIQYLIGNKLLDDQRYAENFLRVHPSRGKVRLKYELLRKGINSDLIEDILSGSDQDTQITQALEVAKSWWQSKYKSGADQFKLKQLLMAKLSRQGFEYEVIRQVIEKLQ